MVTGLVARPPSARNREAFQRRNRDGRLGEGKTFYREVFEFESLGERDVESEGARSAAFRVGDFALEVMQPVNTGTPLADFVASHGGGVYSLNFKVKSVPKAAEYLKSKSLRLIGDHNRRFSIDPAIHSAAASLL